MLQKWPFYAYLMLRASRFSSTDISKNTSYSDDLPETLTEDKHFNARHWINAMNHCNWFKPLRKLEAVGELNVP